MPRMTGGQALARQLYREGVRVIFGLPGVQLYHLLDGLHEQSEIRFITTRHEQATTYMADGFSRAGGGIGTALVVPGPGLQNASAGIGTAYSASSPILVIAGQVEQDLIGVDRGVLHEINDQLDTIRPVIKWSRRILAAQDVPGSVHEAFHQLQPGRPRPVEIEIPPDTLAEEADVELVDPVDYQRPAAAAAEIRRGAELLANASNPAIWAGGGVHLADAHTALLQVAEHLQAPVFATGEDRGAVSDRHYLSLGPISFGRDSYRDRRAEHDLIFAVGTRLATPGLLDSQQVLQLDIDAQEIGRNHERTVGMVGDARATLAALYAQLAQMIPPRASRKAELEALYAQRFDAAAEPLKSFMRAIRAGKPDDGIIVQDFTQLGYYSRSHLHVAKAVQGEARSSSRTSRSVSTAALPDICAAFVHHSLLFRHPGLRLPDGARCQGGETRPCGGGDFRRRRLLVQLAGTGDRCQVRHQRGGDSVQRQRLRQRAARSAQSLRRPRVRFRAVQSGLHEARRRLRRAWGTGGGRRGPGSGAEARRRQRRSYPDRGSGRGVADSLLTRAISRECARCGHSRRG